MFHAVFRRNDIGHAAAAVDVVHHEGGAHWYLQQQTVGAGHLAPIAAAVEVADSAALQVPLRTDLHLSRVVAAKEAAYLELGTAGIGETQVNTHVVLDTVVGQQIRGT